MKKRLRVMHSVAPPEQGKTRFIDHIVEGAPSDVEVLTFSWKSALRGGFDVFHVHWPERLLRKGWGRTLLLLAMLRLRRVPIVRTLHNINPHESGNYVESKLLRLMDRQTALFVRLNDHTPVPPGALAVTIPHPHYAPRFDAGLATKPVCGRILYFGIVRPYKGVQALVDAFSSLPNEDASLRVVGSAKGDRGDGVREACAADPRISARLEYVPDDELYGEILSSELVVLPYRQMHNSGALLLSLTLQRPVLVPKNPVNQDIAHEVGDGWVFQFEGDLDGTQLLRALRQVQSRSAPMAPDLRLRDWHALGVRLRDAYSLVVSRG